MIIILVIAPFAGALTGWLSAIVLDMLLPDSSPRKIAFLAAAIAPLIATALFVYSLFQAAAETAGRVGPHDVQLLALYGGALLMFLFIPGHMLARVVIFGRRGDDSDLAPD
jgi:hypothetical protein